MKEVEDGRSAAVCSPVVGTRGIACTNSQEDCAIVAAVKVVTLAANARAELELGPSPVPTIV